jgi:signal transduction histidine kinase
VFEIDRLQAFKEVGTNSISETIEAPVVGKMRLAIALAMLLTFVIDHPQRSDAIDHRGFVLAAYLLHSAVLFFAAEFRIALAQGKLNHWLDVLWFALIVFSSGGVHSAFFLAFLFAILNSSFRWGAREGLRVAITSAIVLAACGTMAYDAGDLPQLLLRIVFLLALGYLSACWGEATLRMKRQLVLLRDVSRLANPRFGVNQTINSVLQKTLDYYNGCSCVLVTHDRDFNNCSLRSIKRSEAGASGVLEISMEAAQPLLDSLPEKVVVYRSSRPLLLARRASCKAYEQQHDRWIKIGTRDGASLAALLEAHAFISTPLRLRNGYGRVYVTSTHHAFDKKDALFLNDVCAQAFPVIENIELLDQIASRSAVRERRRIAMDLHDSTIQPCIGMKLGLSALLKKAAPGKIFVADLQKLLAISTEIIAGLRSYVNVVENGAEPTEEIFEDVIHRYAAQSRDFYGIAINVSIAGKRNVNDRLAVEVLQLVSEGLSNMRRHTAAKSGALRIRYQSDLLMIEIENDGDGVARAGFTPQSITRRATALGGQATVQRKPDGGSTVHVQIPV